MLEVFLLLKKLTGSDISVCGTVKHSVLIHFSLRSLTCLFTLVGILIHISLNLSNLALILSLFSLTKFLIKFFKSVIALILNIEEALKNRHFRLFKLINRAKVLKIILMRSKLFLSKLNFNLTDFLMLLGILWKSLSSGKLSLNSINVHINDTVKTCIIYLLIKVNLTHYIFRIELIKLSANKLRDFDFLIIFNCLTVSLFSGFLFLALKVLIILLRHRLRSSCCHFSCIINKIDSLNKPFIAQSIVSIVLKKSTYLKHTNNSLLLLLCKIIEEERNYIKCCTDSGNNNKHTKKRNKNTVNVIKSVRRIENILTVGRLIMKYLTNSFGFARKLTSHKSRIVYNSSCSFNIHTELFLKSRNNR